MVSIFNAKLVREKVKHIDFIGEVDLNQGMITSKRVFPHVYAFSQSFTSETTVFVDPAISIVTSYGHQSWKGSRNRIFSLGALDSLIQMYDRKILSDTHLMFAVNGLAKACRNEFKNVLASNEFDQITQRYKDILLKAMFYDTPKQN
jgi:hypothetical protein